MSLAGKFLTTITLPDDLFCVRMSREPEETVAESFRHQ
jgi:hypothetical protein